MSTLPKTVLDTSLAFACPSSPPISYEGGFEAQRGMTLREYAAIQLKVPDSGNEALDAMIRRARRDDLAQAVMQGFATDPTVTLSASLGEFSYMWADNLLSVALLSAAKVGEGKRRE